MKHLLTPALLLLPLLFASGQRKVTKPQIGIAQDYQQDSLLHANGFHYLVESIPKCISPLKFSDQEFEANVKIFQKLKVPIYAVNIFIPGDLKLVGPEIKQNEILAYTRIVFARCQRLGIKMVVWGSGGARRVPEGFDPAQAKVQFISLARKVAVVAKEFDVRLALENLNSTETNFINTVADALEVVKAVNHPNFMLCVDIYHMLMENEPPLIIEKTKPYLIHCDIAEKENRAPPGVKGDDFRSYLKALHKVGYNGVIILECRWGDLSVQAPAARLKLQQQIDEVYAK